MHSGNSMVNVSSEHFGLHSSWTYRNSIIQVTVSRIPTASCPPIDLGGHAPYVESSARMDFIIGKPILHHAPDE